MILYLGLGWSGITSTALLWNRFGLAFIAPLLGGAAAYTVGAMLELFHWPTLASGIVGPHEVFHLAVLAGLGFHWAFIHDIAAVDTINRAPLAVGSRHPRRAAAFLAR